MRRELVKSRDGFTIPLTRPEVSMEELRAVARVLKSRWLAQGPEVEALEVEFARYVGAAAACAVSSATAALHLALRALGIRPGDEVIVPTHTFVATVNAVLYCGAEPVFVDIALDTYCIDPRAIADLITPRTACILIVHQMGIPCDLKPILEIAQRHHLPVIEDAACALGSEYLWDQQWELIGKPHGDIACFSFHPRKVITCGEGGMLTCRDPYLLERIRRFRQHGLDSIPTPQDRSVNRSRSAIEELGYNYRLSDISAAILRCQLRRLPDLVVRRRQLAAKYDAAFDEIPGCRTLRLSYGARPNYQSYPLRLTAEANLSRDQLIHCLARAGIESKPGIMNVHELAKYLHPRKYHLPNSETANRESILLPLYPSMTESQQQKIIRTVTSCLI